jgi:phenylpropionate dioxygenase-like ring-hydroxylating dioxygenase large terminal subunit
MLSKEDNALLTQAGPGTPMGELMRRYWIPALLSEELPAPDCAPIQIKLLGEELIAFRDTNGRVGIMDEHCAHRGTSLFYGRNEECGLRCIYHGWKYDVDGNVVDTPAEPAGSRFKEKLRQTAYPTHEAANMVFVYMGPKEHQPLFPNYEWALADPKTIIVTKSLQDCNYLQGIEGECDSTHLQYLHWNFAASGFMRDYYRREMLEYVTEQADFGMRLVAVRDAGEGQAYVRVSSFVMPVDCWVPARTGSVHFYVPAGDDAHSWRINMRMRVPEEQLGTEQVFWDENYQKKRNIHNHYLQDREAQKNVNFTGMGDVFVTHDSAATETMGPIYDRSKEHLGASDKAVIAVRNYLLRTVRAFQETGEVPNVVTDPAKNRFSHVDVLNEVIDGTDWRTAFPHLTASATTEAPREALVMSRA